MTRPCLEWQVRRHLLARPGVTLRQGVAAESLLAREGAARAICGVNLRTPAGAERLEADLVVDASGRGTRTPLWLAELGHPQAPESLIKVDLAYSSRLVRLEAAPRDWKVLIVYGRPPGRRAGLIFQVEGGQCLVTLMRYHGDHPPADHEGFMDFARSLAVPDLFDSLQHAEMLTEAVPFRFPGSLRRHYERLPSFPDGFRYAETVGEKPPGLSLMNWYTGRIHELCGRDNEVMNRFVHVQHMLHPPTDLFALPVLLKVLTKR